jgi:DNA segregation ATPase FtsK/SpoIIIE-like protein
MPALVILIDEYAELAENAPGAMSDADSIARLGRAVAVTLIAATQRPTQKAMGAGAVRSQMDLRICFRVREPRDVDLILGQGMLKAGWDAHNLNAPGKFLVSAPGLDRPNRARAYLLTDEVVAYTATHYVGIRPVLDEESRCAIDYARRTRAQSPDSAPAAGNSPETADERETTDSALWQALCAAPAEGMVRQERRCPRRDLRHRSVTDQLAGTGTAYNPGAAPAACAVALDRRVATRCSSAQRTDVGRLAGAVTMRMPRSGLPDDHGWRHLASPSRHQ